MAREPREQIVARILDATIACVFEYGLDAVQLTQIATTAGMSARTLSRYYPEKEALLADAATRYLSANYAAFVENYEKAPKAGLSGRERLLLFLSLQKDHFKERTLEAMMMVDLRFYRVRHGNTRPSWTIPGGDGVRGIVIDCIEDGMRDGSIRTDLDPAMTSALISATYNGMMQRMTMIYRSAMDDARKEPLYGMFGNYIDLADRYLRP